jgi:predicted ATPase
LFAVLYSLWTASYVAFNGDAMCTLSAQFLTLAERQGTTVPLMIGHRMMGASLLCTGDIAQSRAHLDRAVALYDPAEHRPLSTRFGQDARMSALCWRSLALWLLGYPEAALTDADQALRGAREMSQAVTLIFAQVYASVIHICCGIYDAANAQLDEVGALADEKGILFWNILAKLEKGWTFSLTGKASDAVHMITAGIARFTSTGSTVWMPLHLSYLAGAYRDLGQLDDAWHSIGEAMTTVDTTKERWWEAEVHRIAGEIALKSPEPDEVKAEAYFERALTIARQQQAKSWELRAAMSTALLWRDQGKRDEARDLLAPVYGWFTEGFDTLDLREAKALLDELAS